MTGHHLLRLAREERGMATVEFALLSVLFFFVMTAGLDIGMWYQQRLRVDSAVEQGSMIAFASRASVDQSAVATYVAAAALNAACADGSLAGYYMTIKAVATSNTMLVPAAMLGGSMVQTRSAVVRLE